MAMATTAGEAPAKHYLNHEKTFKSWALSVDHKRIGIMYMVTLAVVFLIAGVLALLVRIELMSQGPTIMDAQTYNQVFSMHGIMMVFLFLVPSIPAIMGNFVMPIQIGAIDVAFPRLNLASFYIYLIGGVLVVFALMNGAVDTGWTFYTPYSKSIGDSVLWMTMAVVRTQLYSRSIVSYERCG